MSVLRILDPNDVRQRQAWDSFVHDSKDGTVFHTTAWMDVIRKGLGLQPRFSYLEGPGGAIQALVPLFKVGSLFSLSRWMNLPQSIPSRILTESSDNGNLLLQHIARRAATEGAKAVCLLTEVRHQPILDPGWEVRREDPVRHHVLSLDGSGMKPGHLPQTQPRFRTTVKKYRSNFFAAGGRITGIQKAEVRRFALTVHREFYWKRGFLSFPIEFYRELLENLKDQVRITVMESSSGKALGYVVCFWSPPTAHAFIYGNFLGGKESGAAIVGLGQEIYEAARAGLRFMDFGESGPLQKGIIMHKERWGARAVDGSYLVISKKGSPSGLRMMGDTNSWSYPLVRNLPSWLALKLARSGHRLFQ